MTNESLKNIVARLPKYERLYKLRPQSLVFTKRLLSCLRQAAVYSKPDRQYYDRFHEVYKHAIALYPHCFGLYYMLHELEFVELESDYYASVNPRIEVLQAGCERYLNPLREGIRQCPESADAGRKQLAGHLARLERFEEALAELDQMSAPPVPQALGYSSLFGIAYCKGGRYEQAARYLESAPTAFISELRRGDSRLHTCYCLCLEKLGRKDEAAAWREQALRNGMGRFKWIQDEAGDWELVKMAQS